ncbi:hypothetical protein LVO79_04325 [Roseivivax marinus]|uniref:hypothetical protein n=1 Tax=Roseivivax marinus TaxID=1379903 RepID=UPI001F04E58E|nr:hypothetical protein [Roseivivax marinus]UMA65696.1 hypothetical protein LVO79_04325 [Roseivivax marinus]
MLRYLEDAGIETEKPQTRDILIVGAITRRTLTPNSTRRISMLPYYALQDAMERAEALETIISDHPDRDTLRYEVLHPHEPCDAEELDERLDSLNDHIQAFSNAVRRHGGQIVWTSIEVLHQVGGLFLVHANLVSQASEPTMRKVKAMADGRFGSDGWYDGGVIRDADRLASYVTKSPDLRAATAREAVAYHRATQGRQLHRRAQDIPTAATDIVEAEDPEAAEPLESANREQSRSPQTAEMRCNTGRNREHPARKFQREQKRNTSSFPVENRILRDLGTMFLSPHAEPALLVEGYTEYPTTDAGRLGLAFIRRKAMAARFDWLQRGGDPAYFSCQEESKQNWDPYTSHS